MQWLSRLSASLCVVLLAGCSSMQLAYLNAPLLAQYQLDRYLDLSDEQEQLLKTELAQLRAWHQSQALPVYAKTLRQWAQVLSQPHTFSTEEILEKQQDLQTAALVFAQHASQALSPVLLTLTPRQEQRLAQRFDASNQEYASDFLGDPQQAMALRQERFIKNYERWLGSLTTAQLTLLSDWLSQHPNDTHRWAQERLSRQAALLDLINQAPNYESRQQAAQALDLYFHRLATPHNDERQSQQASRQLALAQLTAQMLNLMTPQQRKHLQEQLNSYAADFESLAKRANARS